MKENNLQTHTFIYADVPFDKWKMQYSSFFKCVTCGTTIQVAPR